MLLPVVLFASFALVQQQAPAQAEAATPQPRTQAAQLAPVTVDRPESEVAQVCRNEPVTGSRFGRRVCRSAVQTDEDRAASREMLRQMQGARVPPAG